MRDIRLPATGVDGFRFWRGAETYTTEDYLKRILGADASAAMTLGIDFENHLMYQLGFGEGPTINLNGSIKVDRPHAVQMWVSKHYEIGNFRVKVLGKVDAIHGRKVIDWKTTGKGIEADKYLDSYQWRFYLDMLPGYDLFRYEVFRLSRPSSRGVDVIDQARFDVSRYPGMGVDVHDALADWLGFLMELERAEWIVLTKNGTRAGPRLNDCSWVPDKRRRLL